MLLVTQCLLFSLRIETEHYAVRREREQEEEKRPNTKTTEQ